MKYPAHIYAKALVAVLADTDKTGAEEARIAENFLALVRKSGDEMYLRKILEEASRFARGKGGVRKVTVESARVLTKAQHDDVSRFIKKEDVVEERVDASLIAGIKITLNDELQFDGSLKNKLSKALGGE